MYVIQGANLYMSIQQSGIKAITNNGDEKGKDFVSENKNDSVG